MVLVSKKRYPKPSFYNFFFHSHQSFAAAIKASYPDLAPLPLSITPVAAHAACVTVAKDQMAGWEVTEADEAALSVTAVATTPLMRFKDDIVVRVRPAPKGPGAIVDVRVRFLRGREEREAGFFFGDRSIFLTHPPHPHTHISPAPASAKATWAPTRPASGRT